MRHLLILLRGSYAHLQGPLIKVNLQEAVVGCSGAYLKWAVRAGVG